MKKIIFLLVTIFFIQSSDLKAQAFEKGNFNIDLGFGFGLYGTKSKTTTELSGNFLGVPVNQSFESDTTDGAASRIIPLNFEYGISNKFGIGLDIGFSNYYIDEDDRDYINSVKGVDFGVRVNYHLLNADKNDLFIGLGLGGSSVNWDFKADATNVFGLATASGTGSYFSLGISDRLYFSDHVGMIFRFEYRRYNYPEVEYELSDEQASLEALGITDLELKQTMEWKLGGVHLGVGLALKF